MAQLPSDFLWGFATAAYQIEGSPDSDGRGPSIWDTFCKIPNKITDGTSGDVACDSYNRTEEDIALLKQLGAKAYRFSISWSRIVPLGGRNDPVNEKGVQHYVKFVDDLLAAGIVPFVTLFHWDLPQALHDRYGGMLKKDEFVPDFVNYARIMFEAMGDRVKHWITFNEPWVSSIMGYGIGIFAPGRTSFRSISDMGDSSTEPWIVGHSFLVAHAYTVKLYRNHYKQEHGGEIGITLNGDWGKPWDPESEDDKTACGRRMEFTIGWFADPVYFGCYPESMVEQLGTRLPSFTAEERDLIKGSNDFYGMNHYTAHYIKHCHTPAKLTDMFGNLEVLYENKHGESIGPETASEWLHPSPQSFRKILNWISSRYGRPKIYVTENGTSIKKESTLSKEDILEDDFRVQYYKDYIAAMVDAVVHDDVNVRGYLAWSLMDNFEWSVGLTVRFGVTFVDYDNEQKRYPKKSAKMLGDLFSGLIEG